MQSDSMLIALSTLLISDSLIVFGSSIAFRYILITVCTISFAPLAPLYVTYKRIKVITLYFRWSRGSINRTMT